MSLSFYIKNQIGIALVLAVGFGIMVPTTLITAQNNANLPVAIAIAVPEAAGTGGQVVTFNEVNRSYTLSRDVDSNSVYGVTVANPPLLFATATNTAAVITSGSVYVRFTTAAGAITRGDLLVTASEIGVAQKAAEEDKHVFAIALENSTESNNGQILVQFDPVTAAAMHAENIEAAELARATGLASDGTDGTVADEEEPGFIQKLFETYARGVIAAVIAIGSLFFVMYSFRSTIMNATLAVGRNPRARNAIMTVSVGNIIFALIICAVAIFVALAILVLPV